MESKLLRGQSRKRKAENDLEMTDGKKLEDLLPSEINIVNFAKCRARELLSMSKMASDVKGNRSSHQLVPNHMRRRAASHNVKRLPRRLREAAKTETEKRNMLKCPSRRHRRRPNRLLQEYARRQRKFRWLETHIWHAKRFHMTECWGYRLALHPNDKSFRAAYRASTHHCIMQDVSYLQCIEVQGPQEQIISNMNRLIVKDTGASFGGAAFIHGQREGTTMLYSASDCDHCPIGPVQFMWRPVPVTSGTSNDVLAPKLRQLWIWVHPGCLDAVLGQIMALFGKMLVSEPTVTTKMETKSLENQFQDCCNKKQSTCIKGIHNNAAKKQKMVSQAHPADRKHDPYENVSIRCVTHDLCRFRLTGPHSQSILSQVLQPAHVPEEISAATDNSDLKWWQTFYAEEAVAKHSQKQKEYWLKLKGVRSAGELQPRGILGMLVRDPRLFKPKKKAKSEGNSQGAGREITTWPSGVSDSPLWEEVVRKEVKATKMADHEMNKRRASLLEPGSDLDLGVEESRIPVLLVQRPGRRPSSEELRVATSTHQAMVKAYGSGWDIILPGGWAMAFWVSLVYHGARVGGLRDSLSLSTEEGSPHFPEDFPDTSAGHNLEFDTWQKLQEKYNRRPPNKKPNHVKMGVAAPFRHPWKELLNDWSASGQIQDVRDNTGTVMGSDKEAEIPSSLDNFQVLRSKAQQQHLAALCSTSAGKKPGYRIARPKNHKSFSHINIKADTVSCEGILLPPRFSEQDTMLVQVRLDVVQRGRPCPFSLISIPTSEDLLKLKQDKLYGGPLEPKHKLSGRAKVDRVKKLKNKKGKEAAKEENSKTALSTKVTPDKPQTVIGVKDSCSRPVIGFLKRGGDCLSSGNACGIGFVGYNALLQLLKAKPKDQHAIVLVRNPSSFQWRFCYLTVVTR